MRDDPLLRGDPLLRSRRNAATERSKELAAGVL